MKIPFDASCRRRYNELLEEIFDSNFWSEGPIMHRFEEAFGEFAGLPGKAVCNCGAGLLACMEYADVRGGKVIVPSNTFRATAQAAKMAGAEVVYADCNRADLCLSLDDLKRKWTPEVKAVVVVHIGGHLAFEIEGIAQFCAERGVVLIEDCAHCHGADWNGKNGGSWGLAGVYSFYATKTMPLGEGGMVVSRDAEFLNWLTMFRNYGKKVENGVVSYPLENGFNFRMNDVTAALGLVQLEQMPDILAWKRNLAAKYDTIFSNRVEFPEGMTSGYYKYIVFGEENLTQRTGQVFGPTDLCHVVDGLSGDSLPNSVWVAENHQCPPMWYGWDHADDSPEALRALLLEDKK
ncbi:MAG: DegT/DnrJ/EryC1/StrS family aminotransferase [Desulfovibrio sp.]|uniref:DegT/DnrJ/EryC1/StrS family aminotransferase n=1 Tax=Desulfovibrio sp. 7SRBS1 TaxID=3378064 RepID=UPI003B3EB26B